VGGLNAPTATLNNVNNPADKARLGIDRVDFQIFRHARILQPCLMPLRRPHLQPDVLICATR